MTATQPTTDAPEPTRVAKSSPRGDLKAELERYAEKIATYGVDPQAYITSALIAAVKLPDLYKCTPASVALALTQCAQVGLEIGRTAHLVPFGTAATFIADYKGLIELAISTGKVVAIRTRCVYANEQFEYAETGAGPDIRHVPMLSGDRGAIIGAYAIADLRFGRFKVEYMTAEEIDEIRKSKSKSWKNGPLPDWYGRKTVVRKLCKTLPASKRLQAALRADDTEDGLEIPDGEYSIEEQQSIAAARKQTAIAAPSGADPYGASTNDTGVPRRAPGEVAVVDAEATMADPRYRANAAAAAAMDDPYGFDREDDGDGSLGL